MSEMKKVSVKKVKLSDLAVGEAIDGTFTGFQQGEAYKTLDEKTGELVEKTLTQAHFLDAAGERIVAIADKGFVGAINDAMIKEGAWIKAVKLEKQKLSKGRTMNAYDIYTR